MIPGEQRKRTRPLRGFAGTRRSGQVMVEFALVLPLLIILILVTIQYGLYMNSLGTLNQLSREAARYAALHPATDSAITTYLQSVTPSSIKYSDLTVWIRPVQGDPTRVTGNAISVMLSYDMKKKMFLPSSFLGVTIFNSVVQVKTSMVIE